MHHYLVGIDCGGTFTDLVAVETESGRMLAGKVPSTPDDPSRAVLAALDELFAAGVRPEQVSFLAHGTTVATNAILEGKGVRAGLLITRGFRAIYEARGWIRPPTVSALLDPFYEKPPMLVPQSLTCEASERIDSDGEVLTALNESELRAAVRRLRDRGVKSIAVCYLFSFLNPVHEERTAAIIAEEAPGLRVSLSSRVLPAIREYPRLSTTVIGAYVGPVIERYLLELAARLDQRGIATPQVYLMQSNGGLMRMNVGARYPTQTLLSGPAAGVVGGIAIAAASGASHAVTFDMGGTSTDIGVVVEGRAEQSSEGQIAGQDIGIPMLRIRTLGAGGGTIARIGADGLLKVGPESAGAIPGPACYGRGGSEPTVTDANLMLGALGRASLLGGRMSLDAEAARDAVGRLAARLGLDPIATAAGIVRIVNNHMAISLRLALYDQGQDPRRFTMVAFGGAGPIHAAYLARELHIPRVLIPPRPGLLSAAGLLGANIRHIYLRSAVGMLENFPLARMMEIFAALEAEALADAREEAIAPAALSMRREIDLRYQHQGYQLTVLCPNRDLTEADRAALRAQFDASHQRVYGQSAPREPAEVVTFRVISEAAHAPWRPAPVPAADGSSPARAGRRGGHPDRGNGSRAMKIDPISTEVILSRLREVAATMEHALYHSGYSPVLRESQDGTAGLLAADGRIVMISGGLQYHSLVYGRAVESVIERFGRDALRPGETFIVNDPYRGGNSHVPDIVAITPAFHRGRLLAFAVSVAHKADVGGIVPGSSGAAAREIFHDGLLLPPVRYMHAAGIDESVEDIIRSNSRIPEIVIGDLRGQAGCTRLGAQRLGALADEYGFEMIAGAMDELLRSTGARARAAVARWPDGESRAEGFLDHDGTAPPVPVRIATRVIKRGERVTLDFSGCDAQTAGPVNLNAVTTRAISLVAFVAAADPELPVNAGLLEALEFIIPEGRVVSPRRPATVNNYVPTMHVVYNCLMAAFGHFNPGRAVAPSGLGGGAIAIGYPHAHGGRPDVQYELMSTALGGTPAHDGASIVMAMNHFTPSTPIEVLESEYPVRVRRFDLRCDSAGAGRFRGGIGFIREYQVKTACTLTLRHSNHRFGVGGVAGGMGPANSRAMLAADGAAPEPLDTLVTRALAADAVFRIEQSGGAGYGSPLERPPAMVAEDVANGYVSVESAARDYGVVLDPATFAVDEAKTAAARARLRDR